MTSIVKATCHCGTNKEKVVRLFNMSTDELIEEKVLQNGESVEFLIYDDRALLAFEREKEVVQP